MKRVLIGSPIRQNPIILNEFLISLTELNKDDLELSYCFVDDNIDKESSYILDRFKREQLGVTILKSSDFELEQSVDYICDENTHHWKESIIDKVIMYKNTIINIAKNQDFDYLFFIDSDIILHPFTLQQLILSNKDIISNIFWTKWSIDSVLEPQVWLQDVYNMYKTVADEKLSKKEILMESEIFRKKLKKPGVYQVGGLGACTLLSKRVVHSGVNFSRLYNVSFWGEDRHFCIRAAALGFDLFVDTHYPAYHLYRFNDLHGVENYKKNGFVFEQPQEINKVKKYYKKVKNKLFTIKDTVKEKIKSNFKSKVIIKKRQTSNRNHLTLSMIVKNEEHRYLKMVLENSLRYIDYAVIIDDGSTDGTVNLCKEVLKDIPHKIIKNNSSSFKNEYLLRKQQWRETVKTNPDWVLFLDADEILESSFEYKVKELMKDVNIDVYQFKLYDMWNEEEYRSDKYWNAHTRYAPFMVRYQPKFKYKFTKKKQHCGRFPKNIGNLNVKNVDVRLKHYGWSRAEDRVNKYKRYMELDSQGKYGDIEQYKSIMDESPRLIPWED